MQEQMTAAQAGAGRADRRRHRRRRRRDRHRQRHRRAGRRDDPRRLVRPDADDLADLGTWSSPPTATPRPRPTRWPPRRSARSPGGLGGDDQGGAPGGRARLLGPPMYEGVVQDLIDELGRLPGVGPKSAQRIAFHLLQADPADVRRLADVLIEVKEQGEVLRGLRQRRRGGAVPDLPRPAARPGGDLRGRGVQGRRRDRADPRVPGPLPRARRGDLADRGHRPRRAADPRADDPARRRRGHRGASWPPTRTSRARPPRRTSPGCSSRWGCA